MNTKMLSGHTVGLIVIVTATAVAILVAVAVASSTPKTSRLPHRTRATGISVFAHHPRRLVGIAATNSTTPPNGAILAAVDGHTEIYAFHNTRGEDCVIHLTVGASGGSACSTPAIAETEGVVGISVEGEGATTSGSPPTLRATALVPNGVMHVTITDRDGSSYELPVTNNVVEREDINISSLNYELPSGEKRSVDVAAIVDHIPSQPGAPGSTK